jgi:hypothetical protein
MKSFLKKLAGIGFAVVATPAFAVLNVFATVPEWATLTAELGGDKVTIYTATNALQDPHHVEARPSLIAAVNFSTAAVSILLPALAAGILVTATHVPLSTQVLARGIVFIDLAIAQIAGCGVLLADQLGFEAQGAAVQIAALAAALVGALLLTWSERNWPNVQEAVIGVTFVSVQPAACCFSGATSTGASICAICWSARFSGCDGRALAGQRLSTRSCCSRGSASENGSGASASTFCLR